MAAWRQWFLGLGEPGAFRMFVWSSFESMGEKTFICDRFRHISAAVGQYTQLSNRSSGKYNPRGVEVVQDYLGNRSRLLD